MKAYAGIGSRETPPEILKEFTAIAAMLEVKGFILRSGGAEGADLAFENGVKSKENKQIFIPWKGFNKSDSPYYTFPNEKLSEEYVDKFHPAPWAVRRKRGMFNLMKRNTYQVLGETLVIPEEFSQFVLAWAPVKNSVPQGGTSQAIRIALHHHIKVFNFILPEDIEEFYATY